jgi:predicted RNase H-like nuclease
MIDIPIGLTDSGRRSCDEEAKVLLGSKRSSVFFAPTRSQVSATTYEEVRVQGVSLQSFYLFPKIREVDQALCPADQSWLHEAHPELAYQMRSQAALSPPGRKFHHELNHGCTASPPSDFSEVGPLLGEKSDAGATAGTLWVRGPSSRRNLRPGGLSKKRTEAGRCERSAILKSLSSPFELSEWDAMFLRKQVAKDDLLDAAILLEVARAWMAGQGRRTGGDECDSKGLKTEICF